MQKDAWTAAICQPTLEFIAEMELRRLGVHCYLPTHRRRWQPAGATGPMLRSSVLFKGYILVRLDDARRREMHFARGLRQPRPLLSSETGTLWTIGADVVHELMERANTGLYDECDPELGAKVRLRTKGAMSAVDLFVASVDDKVAQLLSPLFGGSRTVARVSDLTRAA
jgi:hypothetical protein